MLTTALQHRTRANTGEDLEWTSTARQQSTKQEVETTLWRMFGLITESQKLAGKETKYSKEKKEKPESTTDRPSALRKITTSINRHYGSDDRQIIATALGHDVLYSSSVHWQQSQTNRQTSEPQPNRRRANVSASTKRKGIQSICAVYTYKTGYRKHYKQTLRIPISCPIRKKKESLMRAHGRSYHGGHGQWGTRGSERRG